MLRSDRNSPAQIAMDEYFRPGTALRGKPVTTLPVALKHDIDLIADLLPPEAIASDHTYTSVTQPTSCRHLKTQQDIQGIRNIARNRDLWRELGSRLMERREAKYATPTN